MTTATLSSAQRRQRSSAARTTTGAAANGINGGGGQPSSLKGKHAAEKANSSSPIPGLSSAPDWPASCSGATTTTPAVQRLSSASEFWERCVVARQPGVLPASALDDDGGGGGGEVGDDDGDKTQTPPSLFTAPSKWTPAYLKSKAGHVLVDVETRKDASDRFGKGGTRTKMTFADFLDKAAASFSSSSSTFSKKGGAADEGTLLYLSAQRPPKPPGRKGKKRGEGGARRKLLLPPPPLGPLALALADDNPVVPKLARGLVLQSVNLWCGRSRSSSSSNSSSSPVSASSSSGLHHDFHDNLYAVVGGTKKFTLFPPAAVAEMRPVGGKPRFVHSNGRIVYRCQGEVGADGGDEGLVRRHEYRRWKEVMLADGVDIEEEEEEEDEEDDDDSDGEGGGKKRLVDDDDNSDEDDDDADLVAALAAAERGAPVADDYSEEEEEGSAGEESSSGSEDEDDDDDDESKDPPSFSTLDPREPAHAALLPMHRSATVEVGPGDLLYLPCGWFHEVSSSSSSPSSPSSSSSASESICSPLHLALNFWFYPPDRARANPQNPYSRPYWRELFVETVEGGDPSSSRLRELCERQGTVVDVDDDYGFGGGGGGGGEEEEDEEGKGGKKAGSSANDDARARAAAVEALREGLDELDALMAGGNSSSSDGDDEDDEDEEMEEEEEIDASKKKKKSRS